MAKEQKSYHLHIDVNEIHKRDQMLQVVERAVAQRGLYISHIGGYSRIKFPIQCIGISSATRKNPA